MSLIFSLPLFFPRFALKAAKPSGGESEWGSQF